MYTFGLLLVTLTLAGQPLLEEAVAEEQHVGLMENLPLDEPQETGVGTIQQGFTDFGNMLKHWNAYHSTGAPCRKATKSDCQGNSAWDCHEEQGDWPRDNCQHKQLEWCLQAGNSWYTCDKNAWNAGTNYYPCCDNGHILDKDSGNVVNAVPHQLIKQNNECGSRDEWIGTKNDASACAAAVLAKGGRFFLFSPTANACWWEKTTSAECTEGWIRLRGYDFYEIRTYLQCNSGVCVIKT